LYARSARLELELAAHLKRCGSAIEFRPPLPNNKEADFAVIPTFCIF